MHPLPLLLSLALYFASTALVAAPMLNHKLGGRVVLEVSPIVAGGHSALIPAQPDIGSRVTLQGEVRAMQQVGSLTYLVGAQGLVVYDAWREAAPQLRVQRAGNFTQLVVQDQIAYLADGNSLLLLDAADPQHEIARLAMPYPADALCLAEGRIYWLGGQQMDVVSVQKPSAPQPLAHFVLAQRAVALQVSNGYAYLAMPERGLSVVDVRDTGNLREVALFRAEPRDVAVLKNRAYLANGKVGLTLLDVSAPAAPRWLGSVNRIGTALSLSVAEERVALSNDRAELMLFDAHNPRVPKLLATQQMDSPVRAISLLQKQVLAASDTQLSTVDFSANIPNVVSLGANFGGSRRAVIRDDVMFVADWFSGLHLYDIKDPAAPRHLSNYHTQGSSKGVLVRGDIAYLADDDHGVQILDISDLSHPRKLSEVATPGLAYTMKLVGDVLYLADHRGGFHLIDVAHPEHAVLLGSAPTAGKAWAVEVVGKLAYVAADRAGLLVFDVSDAAHPTQINALDFGGTAEDIVVKDGLAYVASFDDGFYVFDLSNATQPKQIGHLATPGNARGIALDGHYAYLADWVSGVQVIDIADPAQPRIVAAYDTQGWSWGVQIRDQYAYIQDWWGGIAVLDIRNPTQPTLAGTYHARGMTQDVALQNQVVYVADGSNGVQIFDVKNSLNPIWMSGVDMAGEAQSVWLEDTTLYVATGEQGLVSVDVRDPFTPQRGVQYRVPTDLVRSQNGLLYAVQKGRGVTLIKDKKMAWYGASINDLWPARKRVFIASQAGVDVLDMTRWNKPRVLKHLSQAAQIVRVENNLLVTYAAETGLNFYDARTLKHLSRFNSGEAIADIKLLKNRLYASGKLSGLLVLDISNPRRPSLQAAYPAAQRVSKFAASSEAVFMAGNEVLTSVRLLPASRVSVEKNAAITLQAAPNMPVGDYDLLTLDPVTGQREVQHKVLRSALAGSDKPRFTMQDLQRELRARGLNPTGR